MSTVESATVRRPVHLAAAAALVLAAIVSVVAWWLFKPADETLAVTGALKFNQAIMAEASPSPATSNAAEWTAVQSSLE